jgi:hypothetical protein
MKHALLPQKVPCAPSVEEIITNLIFAFFFSYSFVSLFIYLFINLFCYLLLQYWLPCIRIFEKYAGTELPTS